MSLSLLEAYDSSGEEFENIDNEESKEHPIDHLSTDEQKDAATTENAGKNFFQDDSDSGQDDGNGGGAASSDEGDEDTITSQATSKDPSKSAAALPRPFENYDSAGMQSSSVSVFHNPFLEAERAESAILEHHVKLTDAKLNPERGARRSSRQSSVPCRLFKRGRCRLGEKCRFSHVVATPASSSATDAASTSSSAASPAIYDGKAVRYTEWGKEEIVEKPGNNDDEDDQEGKRKKRRVGVTNSLVPPKKALANYESQRRAEAPWLNGQT